MCNAFIQMRGMFHLSKLSATRAGNVAPSSVFKRIQTLSWFSFVVKKCPGGVPVLVIVNLLLYVQSSPISEICRFF